MVALISDIIFQGEDGPDIRGGSIDALIVHAAAAAKSGELLPFNFDLPLFQ